MHEDERRDPQLTRKMVLREFVSNPDELHREYSRLVEVERKSVERSANLSEIEERRKILEREKAGLIKRLADAHGALGAYRKEVRRLKDDLKRVRGSRSMRIGQAITKPVSFFRRRATSVQQATTQHKTFQPSVAGRDDGPPATLPPTGLAGEERDESKLWNLTYEQLGERLATAPRVDVLQALLSRTWFQRGDIAACETLLAENTDLLGELPTEGGELVARIRGDAAFTGREDHRAAASPWCRIPCCQHGRVMYSCTRPRSSTRMVTRCALEGSLKASRRAVLTYLSSRVSGIRGMSIVILLCPRKCGKSVRSGESSTRTFPVPTSTETR